MTATSNTCRNNASKRKKSVIFGGKARTNFDAKLAWTWIFEYLASFKEIDSSTLYELLEVAPKLPKKGGQNAKEMVALRCLEELFGTCDRSVNVGSYAAGIEVSFDVSMSCEEVLKCVMDLIARGKFWKWNVQPFIRHKRASMPKLALEKIKDAILEDKPPCTALLKKLSGLAHRNVGCHPVACDAGASVVHDSERTVQNIDSTEISPTSLANDAAVGGESRGEISLPCEGDKTELANENIMGDYHENNGGNDLRPETKRSKQNASFNKHPMMMAYKYGTKKADHASGSMDKIDHIETKRLNGDSVARKELDACVGQTKKSNGISDQLKSSNVASLGAFQGKVNLEGAEGNKEHLSKDDASGDNEIDISTRKNQFLRSQCPRGNDSLSVVDTAEGNLCVKCNEGGSVWGCKRPGCPIVVHDKCLGAAASFDKKGDFYCPFCLYSLAVSELAGAKERTSSSRKQFARCFMLLRHRQ